MPRRARQVAGGIIYHVINRGCGKMKLFTRDGDYAAFERLMGEAQVRRPIRLLNYTVMPNHWHLTLWPETDEQLSQFMFWMTMTHASRWRHSRQLVGMGPLYQGRFKAFPIEADDHYLTVARYIERNALRAQLVDRAEAWRWSSLHLRTSGETADRPTLTPWPVDGPADWLSYVNQPQTAAEEEAVRAHIRTGQPFGTPAWDRKVATRLGIPLNPRPRGRPRLAAKEGE